MDYPLLGYQTRGKHRLSARSTRLALPVARAEAPSAPGIKWRTCDLMVRFGSMTAQMLYVDNETGSSLRVVSVPLPFILTGKYSRGL